MSAKIEQSNSIDFIELVLKKNSRITIINDYKIRKAFYKEATICIEKIEIQVDATFIGSSSSLFIKKIIFLGDNHQENESFDIKDLIISCDQNKILKSPNITLYDKGKRLSINNESLISLIVTFFSEIEKTSVTEFAA